jgi:ankyrin repeat protein
LFGFLKDPSHFDHNGKLLFSFFLKNGFLEIVETLIDAGARTETKNDDGDTPLMLAVRSEHAAVVDAMCKRGCDMHTSGFDHIEPIDYAKTKRNLYLSDVLTKHEARLAATADKRNNNGAISEEEEEHEAELARRSFIATAESANAATTATATAEAEQVVN